MSFSALAAQCILHAGPRGPPECQVSHGVLSQQGAGIDEGHVFSLEGHLLDMTHNVPMFWSLITCQYPPPMDSRVYGQFSVVCG